MSDTPKKPRLGENKHKRLRSLSCYQDFHAKVLSGYAITDIAEWLQNDMQECTDIGTESLVTLIARYRKDLSPVEIKTHMTPDLVRKADKVIDEGLDEMAEIQKLYALQMDRIAMGHKFEKMTNVLNKMLGSEISRAAELLLKHHGLKMDLGFNGGRNLGSLTIRPEMELKILDEYGEGAHRAAKNVEAGSRVLSIAKALADLELLTDSEILEIEEE